MKVSTEPLENCQVLLTIEVEPERVEKQLRRGARQLSQRVNIPGFRKGKAPYEIVVTMLGKQAIYEEILEDLVTESYREALAQTQLKPIAQAELEDLQLEPMVIRMRVPLSPEVKPGDYRSIRVPREEITVSEAEIDRVLEELRQSRSRWVEVDQPAEYGDLLTLDIKGTVGEEILIDQRDWELVPARDSQAELLPGFDASFIGMRPGETREFTLTYPADSGSRWAGREAHFVATLKKVQRREQMELNDQFAATVGDFSTLTDLRESIRKGLEAQREMEMRSRHLDQVIEALVKGAELVKYPPVLLEQEIDSLLSAQERQLRQRNIKLDDYLKLNQMTREQYRERLRPQAEQRLVRNLLIGAVAEAEGISVTSEEITAEIERMLQGLDGAARSEYSRLLNTPVGRRLIADDLRTQKTLDRLLAIARGEVEGNAAQAEEAEVTSPAT
ncbi:MAG: trigger factor [Anaerolineae bacterium]|nr:trigger factor [Anaerolineae bacterium]MDW8099805.1 trigger factor [Anaerolineae bacterium]